MAQLAIKGHATRGKEVIEILEMLGGSNPHNYSAHCESFCFYIDEITNSIYYDWVRDCYEDGNTLVFTLEKFLEKFPYKVGDKVIYHESVAKIDSMGWDGRDVVYTVNRNDELWNTIAINLQPYKEAPMYLNKKANKQAEEIKKILEPVKEIIEGKDKAKASDLKGEDYSFRRCGYKIPDGYEFECGIKNEIILKPIKPLYPKTYEECCEILNIPSNGNIAYVGNWVYGGEYLEKHLDRLRKVQQLFICLDAYWKIAGEQMGLGKPWEPDWTDLDQLKYCIWVDVGEFIAMTNVRGQHILAFPTAEMRDAFSENFKDLIELCKELL